MTLSIIILSYNTKDLTLNCLNSIIDQYKEQLANNEFEIIIVDNNSLDESVDFIKEFISKYLRESASDTNNLLKKKKARVSLISDDQRMIRLIENRTNLGFSKGCNVGVGKAAGKYLLFLNSDTEIKDKGLLRMIDYLNNNPKIGILGGKLENEDCSVQKSFGDFYNLWNVFLWLFLGERISIGRDIKKEKKVDWVSGGSMMIRKELFEKLKGFDENFFMYVEDMELCYRAKKMEYSTFFYPHVEILHDHQGSSNRTYAILSIYKGLLYFYKKHKSFWEYFVLWIILKKKALLAIFFGFLINNNYLKKTYIQALKI